jgi:hypothetical protein
MIATAASTAMTPITPATMGRAATSMATMGRATAGSTHRATVGAPAVIAPKQREAWEGASTPQPHPWVVCRVHAPRPPSQMRGIPWGGVVPWAGDACHPITS